MSIDYTEISKSYDNYRSYPVSLIKDIIRFGKVKDGMKILDIGCGTGNAACQLLELISVTIIGIDKSASMLEKAREKSLNVLCADVDKKRLPFADNYFDRIIGTYVVHQFNNPEHVFAECYRVLHDGVLMLLTSGHKQIESAHPVIKKYFPSCMDIDKNRFPDIPEIKKLLTAAGFKDITYKEVRIKDIPINEEYLQKVKNKYISTYHLLPEREFTLGIEKLEAFIRNTRQPEFREWRSTLICGRK
jgi:ubiquinone/menaquinone biosynthesis C-methylase UbiE